jgi:hypothetical protein
MAPGSTVVPPGSAPGVVYIVGDDGVSLTQAIIKAVDTSMESDNNKSGGRQTTGRATGEEENSKDIKKGEYLVYRDFHDDDHNDKKMN